MKLPIRFSSVPKPKIFKSEIYEYDCCWFTNMLKTYSNSPFNHDSDALLRIEENNLPWLSFVLFRKCYQPSKFQDTTAWKWKWNYFAINTLRILLHFTDLLYVLYQFYRCRERSLKVETAVFFIYNLLFGPSYQSLHFFVLLQCH